MRTKRFVLLLILVLALVVTSACGPRAATPATATTDKTALMVQLPAIYLDVAADGQMTLAEGSLTQVLGGLGVDLSDLSMSEENVQKFVGAQIQHLQLDNQPDGLHIFINGEALPTLAWDAESLDSLVNVMGILDVDLGEAGKLLPLLPELGFGLALRFPTTGAARPLATGGRMATAENPNNLSAALATPPNIDLSLNYAADGSFQLLGLNPFMLGMIPADALAQSPETLEGITEMGINSLSIIMRPTGLIIMLNGEPLPYLRSESEDQLLTTIELLLRFTSDDEAQTAQLLGIIRQILPALWRQGLRLSVNFPGA